jgi:hypothetical protein
LFALAVLGRSGCRSGGCRLGLRIVGFAFRVGFLRAFGVFAVGVFVIVGFVLAFEAFAHGLQRSTAIVPFGLFLIPCVTCDLAFGLNDRGRDGVDFPCSHDGKPFSLCSRFVAMDGSHIWRALKNEGSSTPGLKRSVAPYGGRLPPG